MNEMLDGAALPNALIRPGVDEMPQVVRDEARFDRRDDAQDGGGREKRREKVMNHG